jgi:hypothetical protein
MLVIAKDALPAFVRITLCEALVVPTRWSAKVMLDFESETAGAVVPVPVRPMVCGLPGALFVSLIVPLRVPPTVGENATLIEQLALAARLLGQVFVSAKSPFAVIPVRSNGATPEFVKVTF